MCVIGGIGGFPGGSNGKESACNAGDLGSISGSGRREKGMAHPFSSLEKGMATHSSGLAWKIPWIEESGRPVGLMPKLGSQEGGMEVEGRG